MNIGFKMNIFSSKLLINILFCGSVLSSPLQGAPFTLVSSLQKNNWETFTSKKSGFSVKLPGKPEHIQQTINIPQTDLEISYNTYLTEVDETAVYVISVWNYPHQIDMSEPDVNLKEGFGGMLTALPGSQVLQMDMGQLQGFNSLDFLVKNEDLYFQGRLVLVYNTLYQVFAVYRSGENMSDNCIRFIDSFKLLNPEKRNVVPYQNNNRKMNV